MRSSLLLAACLLLVGCGRSQPQSRQLYNRLLNVRCLAFSPDGARLVGGRIHGSDGSQGDLLVWELKGKSEPREVHAHEGDVTGLSFTAGGLLSSGADGPMKLWDSQISQSSREIAGERWVQDLQPGITILRGPGRHTFQPRGAALEVWDLTDGSKPLRRWDAPGAQNLVASADGSLLATLMSSGSVVLWSQEGKRLNEIAGPFSSLDMRPDGKILATGAREGVVKLWDTESGKSGASLPSLNQAIKSLRFSADGQRLAYGCEGHLVISAGTKTVWDLKVDSYASPGVLAWSADGHHLASAGASTVLLWGGL